MKNKLKKLLCTALAAVSLSAMVTVPSSLNAPKTNNAVVNVMEAEADYRHMHGQFEYRGADQTSIQNEYNAWGKLINKYKITYACYYCRECNKISRRVQIGKKNIYAKEHIVKPK